MVGGRFRERAMMVVGLVVSLATVACSSDGGTVRLSAVAAATESADSVRMKFEIEFGGVRSFGEGVMNFKTGDQRVESRVDGADAGNVSLLVDGRAFLGPLKEPESGPRWIRMPMNEDAEVEVVSNQPGFDDIVDSLKRSAAMLEETGRGEVHGDSTTTYAFALDKQDSEAEEDFLTVFRPAKGTMEVGDDGRLRRLVLRPTTKSTDDEPMPTLWSIELWDYGVEVDLQAPTEGVVDFDDPAANELSKAMFGDSFPDPDDEDFADFEDPKLAGEFAKVAAGAWETVTWEVWRAPTTEGDVCQTFEVRPDPLAEYGSIDDGITHNGYSASCVPMPDLGSWRTDAVVLLTSYDDTYWYMEGLAAPGVVALDVTYRDGMTERVPVDLTSGVFVMFKRSRPSIKEIRPDAGDRVNLRCTLEEDDFLNCSGSSR